MMTIGASAWRVSGVYKIANMTNGKSYVGSAVNISSRWSLHRHQLKNGTHHSKKLQRSWDAHGCDSFSFEVLEVVLIRADLIEREQFWIDSLDAVKSGYNIKEKAGSSLGFVFSKESREKMSAAQRGRPRSAESIANQSASTRGVKKSPEHREKLAASARARGAAKVKTYANCTVCGKEFRTFPSELARGRSKYCKMDCYRARSFAAEHDVQFKAWEGEQ